MNENIIYFNSDKDIHCCGVYMIFHINNPNIFYIGSAGSHESRKGKIGFARRFSTHLYSLRKNNHSSKYLQNYINKHGIDGVRMVILEITKAESAVKREQFYLDIMKPDFNTNKISTSCLGIKRSDALKKKWSDQRKGFIVSDKTRKAISNTLKGRTPANMSLLHSPAVRKKAAAKLKGRKNSEKFYLAVSSPVNQIKNDIIVASFQSISIASKSTGIYQTGISLCALGHRKTAGGYSWVYNKKHN